MRDCTCAGFPPLHSIVPLIERMDSPKPAPDTIALVPGHRPRARLRVPEPQAGLPRDRGVLLDEVRVVEQVDAERVARGLVVVVPAQLDRALAVVGGLARRAAVRLRGVAVVRVVRGVDLLDVHEAAGLVVDVGEERRGLALGDLGAARRRAGVGGQRVDEALVRIERVRVGEHLVELRLGDDEPGRVAGVPRVAGVRAAAAGALAAPDAPLAGGAGRVALGPPAGLPVLAAVGDDGAARVHGARAPGGGARRGVRLLRRARDGPRERSREREDEAEEQGEGAGDRPGGGRRGRRGGGRRRGSRVHRCSFRRWWGHFEPDRRAASWTTPLRGTPYPWEPGVEPWSAEVEPRSGPRLYLGGPGLYLAVGGRASRGRRG